MKKTLLTVTIATAIGLTGCASTSPEQSAGQQVSGEAVQDDAASLSAKKVKTSADAVERNYQAAKKENYAYFAPAHWRKVNSAIKEMRSIVSEFDPNDQGFFGGPSEVKVLKQINRAQASLDSAERIKGLVSEYLTQVTADVNYLSPKIGTQWQKAFGQINSAIADLIQDIEDEGKTSGFETRRANIQGRLLQLEVKIVKNSHYAPLLQQLDQLDKALIPLSFSQIKNDLVVLNDAINLSPRDMDKIKGLVAVVKNDLIRAGNVSTEVNWINSIDRRKSETIALRYRNALEKLAINLVDKDISGLSFNNQIISLENEINQKLVQMAASEEQKHAEQQQLIHELRAQLDAALLGTTPENIQAIDTNDAEQTEPTTPDSDIAKELESLTVE